MLSDKKKKKIETLYCTSVKRYRCYGHFFSADHLREVPLNSAGPADHGMCRGSSARDVLYIEGVDSQGKIKKVQCGGYSKDLAKELEGLT